jgi:cell division protein FtsX
LRWICTLLAGSPRHSRTFRTSHSKPLRLFAVLIIGLLSACSNDTSTRINVAPSALDKMDEILVAVDRLNEEIGMDVYSVQTVDSEDAIDGEVIVRFQPELGENSAHETRVGRTNKTHDGVVVRIARAAQPCAIAHELGHAAGLEHVDDPTNLMYRITAANRWGLNQSQLALLRTME